MLPCHTSPVCDDNFDLPCLFVMICIYYVVYCEIFNFISCYTIELIFGTETTIGFVNRLNNHRLTSQINTAIKRIDIHYFSPHFRIKKIQTIFVPPRNFLLHISRNRYYISEKLPVILLLLLCHYH